MLTTKDGFVHLLLATTPDQQAHLARFSRLAVFHGHKVSVTTGTPSTLSELELKCKTAGIEGILIANQQLLDRALNALPDFQKPIENKQLSLDDYQGSFISVRSLPAVVLNPPEHIMSVPYGAFIFSRFITKLTKPTDWFPATNFNWKVFDPRDLPFWREWLRNSRLIAIDIETFRNDPLKRISCISFTGWQRDAHQTQTVVIPFDSVYNLAVIREFADLPAPKVFQGGTYDNAYLLRYNIPVRNWLYDTLHLFHSYYSELPKRLDFVTAFTLRNVRFWKDDGKSGNLENYFRYNGMDGWATLNSCLSLLAELPEWALRNYTEHEFPLVYPALHCELEGWRVAPDTFKTVKATQTAEADKRLASLRKMLKAPNYNPGSWQQNTKVFIILGCGDLKGTGEPQMKKAEYRHPLNARIIGDIREYKKARKLVSNYCDESKIWQHSENNWRLHYRLNPAGTDTGRLASSESSFWTGYQIQNIPRGPRIKQYLVADEGWKLGEPDFEQSESRCTFYLAGEEKGIAVVESGKDFHCWNAQLFFGFKYEDLWDEKLKKCKTPEAKQIRDEPAKRTNHGANYNMTGGVMLDTVGPKVAARMKMILHLPSSMSLKDVCQYCLNQWSKTYPKVQGQWYDAIRKEIELTKKLVSALGWTRHFFGDVKNNRHYFNAAVAHGSQNLSVAIINRKFYKLWWEQIYGKLRGVFRIKAQIHDSIPFQYKQEADWVPAEVSRLMENSTEVRGADGKVRTMRIPVGMSYGKERWSELK
jgi:hypothetical protein